MIKGAFRKRCAKGVFHGISKDLESPHESSMFTTIILVVSDLRSETKRSPF